VFVHLIFEHIKYESMFFEFLLCFYRETYFYELDLNFLFERFFCIYPSDVKLKHILLF